MTPLVHRVIARLNVGGPAMHVVNLTRGLEDRSWGGRLVAGGISESEGDMAYYAEERGVEVHYLPALSREISPLDDLRALWALYRLFRVERPDVVHTHTAKAGTLGRLAAILAGVPVLVHTFHGHVLGGDYFSPARTRFFLEVERQLARATDRLVVLTEAQATEMSEELGVADRSKFTVVPLGLELDGFAEVDRAAAASTTRAALGITDDELVIGIVGRMVPIKNHELWLRVLADTIDAHDGAVRGVVVGAGEREAELRALADELGVGDRLLWLGWRRDLPDLYAAMDALVLTSHDEGTPVAVIEAMAAGTPVVARDVGGVAELAEGHPSVQVVRLDAAVPEWATAVIRARSHAPAALDTRRRVVRRFSVERLADDIDELYRALGARG
jgi:glycosyltransferase involved in cell wall biosynthesis